MLCSQTRVLPGFDLRVSFSGTGRLSGTPEVMEAAVEASFRAPMRVPVAGEVKAGRGQRAKVRKQAGFCFRDRCGNENKGMLRQTPFSILFYSLLTP